MLPYAVIVRYSTEDEAYLAEVPQLPGCVADGESPEAARAAVEQVAREWIATARELGRPLPK